VCVLPLCSLGNYLVLGTTTTGDVFFLEIWLDWDGKNIWTKISLRHLGRFAPARECPIAAVGRGLDVTGENDLVGFGSMIDLIIGHSSGLT
jgi:hypothetical protein